MRNFISITKYVVLLFVLALLSCKKSADITFNDNTPPKDFNEVFERFWTGVNSNYLYWDIDSTDWDFVYKKYKVLFSNLDINDRDDSRKAVTYFKEMTSSLIDGHFQITFENSFLNGVIINPSLERKRLNGTFQSSYNYQNLVVKYLDEGYSSVIDNTNQSGYNPLRVVTGSINHSITYFYCNKFLLSKFYKMDENVVKTALKTFFENITKKDCKGIVLDFRNNEGGDISDLQLLVGNIIKKPTSFGYSKYKNGKGRFDYTPWIAAEIRPLSKGVECPVTILVDANTISLGETIAIAVDNLPNGVTIGTTTWGATGPLADYEIYNSGQFKIGNFMTVYTSSAAFKSFDGFIYEGVGVKPNQLVLFDLQKANRGIDTQLEEAIRLTLMIN